MGKKVGLSDYDCFLIHCGIFDIIPTSIHSKDGNKAEVLICFDNQIIRPISYYKFCWSSLFFSSLESNIIAKK